ncbi:MAG: hypothetical protein LBB52_04080 [Desulfovibrio sp.]|nr:hypothetical protein [Desulfovibrio sp.]
MVKLWRVEPACPAHIEHIAVRMREADRREVWASHRYSPAQALKCSLERSDLAWTCFVDGVPSFMWGAARAGSIIGLKGSPWLLGTDAIRGVQKDFLRFCPVCVERMNRRFPRLENFIHPENRLSILWLKWCGFQFDEEVPELINDEEFYLFWRDV